MKLSYRRNRQAVGLSLRQLAALVGVSHTTIARYESGAVQLSRVRVDIAARYLQALRLPYEKGGS